MLDPLVFEQLGELRAELHVLKREHADAHAVLDALEIPRADRFQGEYSLTARLEHVRLDLAAREIQLLQANQRHDALAILYVATEHERLRLETELVPLRVWQQLRNAIRRAARVWNKRTIVYVFRHRAPAARQPKTERP